MPSSMQRFWSLLLRTDLGNDFLDGMDFCILGLGDSKYAEFNWAAKKLRRRLLQLGATELRTVLCDESAPEGLDTAAITFYESFEDVLKTDMPPISKTVLLPPLNRCDITDRTTLMSTYRSGLSATVSKNLRVTAGSHFQDTRHLVLSHNHDLSIDPGDVLAFTPQNGSLYVDRFLELMQWQEIADRVLTITQLVPTKTKDTLPTPITIRSLARYIFPLNDVPPQSFFSQLRFFCTDANFIEKFDDWETSEGRDDFYDYITRPRRTLLEVLEDFSSGLKVPFEYALDLFGRMRPREYSIAGSSQNTIELLIALVQYQTRIKLSRQGVASRYLKDLEVGASFEFTVRKNHMPNDNRPAFCIGPGTGYAPLRFLLSRKNGGNLLFGCRSKDDDYANHPDLSINGITKWTAYSRIEEGQYVQAVIPTLKDKLAEVIDNGGRVYISGSSGNMPKSVREAIDATHGRGTIDRLRDEGRYWEETW